jgi:hypothetical protein
MRVRALVIGMMILGWINTGWSQSCADTVKPKPRHITIKPTTDFDQRFSFIRSQSVNIWGQRGGILLNDWLKLGVGGYYMDDTRLNSNRPSNGAAETHYSKTSLIFGTAYIEPFLLRRKYWELSVPVEAGYGKADSKVYAETGDISLRASSRNFVPTGAGLSLSLKFPPIGRFLPTSWVGINFLAGYRYCPLASIYKTNYDGAFWSISGALFLDRISDDYKAWKARRCIAPKAD